MGTISVNNEYSITQVPKTPDDLYHEYLNKHIQGVKDTWEQVLKPALISDLKMENVPDEMIQAICFETDLVIKDHDASKYGEEEWVPYRDHFYDNKGNPRDELAYKQAWNHHQKHNPHHWQYWVLIQDTSDPQLNPMPMPIKHLMELLADWQSAGHHYGNTAYSWYQENKHRMHFHPDTQALLEHYLELLKEDTLEVRYNEEL